MGITKALRGAGNECHRCPVAPIMLAGAAGTVRLDKHWGLW